MVLPMIDRESLELSKRLMSCFGEMIQWRGVLSDEAENAYKAISAYVRHLEDLEKEEK